MCTCVLTLRIAEWFSWWTVARIWWVFHLNYVHSVIDHWSFFLNFFTEFNDKNSYHYSKMTQTCHLLCRRPGCYDSASNTHVRNRFFKLSPICASVIYQIPWKMVVYQNATSLSLSLEVNIDRRGQTIIRDKLLMWTWNWIGNYEHMERTKGE